MRNITLYSVTTSGTGSSSFSLKQVDLHCQQNPDNVGRAINRDRMEGKSSKTSRRRERSSRRTEEETKFDGSSKSLPGHKDTGKAISLTSTHHEKSPNVRQPYKVDRPRTDEGKFTDFMAKEKKLKGQIVDEKQNHPLAIPRELWRIPLNAGWVKINYVRVDTKGNRQGPHTNYQYLLYPTHMEGT